MLPSTLHVLSMMDNGDSTYTVELDQPATYAGGGFPDFDWWTQTHPTMGTEPIVFLSGSGTSTWQITNNDAASGCTSWNWTALETGVTPPNAHPASGLIT